MTIEASRRYRCPIPVCSPPQKRVNSFTTHYTEIYFKYISLLTGHSAWMQSGPSDHRICQCCPSMSILTRFQLKTFVPSSADRNNRTGTIKCKFAIVNSFVIHSGNRKICLIFKRKMSFEGISVPEIK